MLFQGMKELKEFCIPFSSLKLGPNFFDFEIDNSFFDIFNYSRYNNCNISLNLEFRKKNLLMDLRFSYSGYCEVFCDRCLDLVKVPISNKFNCLIKFLHQEQEIIKDDIVYLPEESYEYNIGQLFYEYFLINFPKRVIHKENQCNSNQIKLMEEYSQKQNSLEEDPRWNILKRLKNEN